MVRQERGSKTVILFISVMFISLALATFLHDPLLHTAAAHLFGWNIESYESSLLTGSTTALAGLNATMWQIWFYYMFPSTMLISLAIFTSLFFNNRLIFVTANILIMLNFASLEPSLSGSDSGKALQILKIFGYTTEGFILQFSIFCLFIAFIAVYWYIIFENNPKDSVKRLKSIF
jgi:hypothetical protein